MSLPMGGMRGRAHFSDCKAVTRSPSMVTHVRKEHVRKHEGSVSLCERAYPLHGCRVIECSVP